MTAPAQPSAIPTREIGHAGDTGGWWWTPESTPELRWPLNILVFDQMRRTDPQVQSVLRAVGLPIRRTPWSITPGAASPEVAQFVADNLGLRVAGTDDQDELPRTRDRFSWADHVRHALLMLPFGHSFFEQQYRLVGEGRQMRAWIRKIAPRLPVTLEEIQVADDGGLVHIKQYAPASGATREQRPIPVTRLVAYVNEREGGNWRGQSLLRSCYKDWLLKDRLLRVDTGTIERNGMGIPVYEGAEDAQGADKESGLAIAKSIRAGESAGAYTPPGAKLRLMGVEGDLPKALDSIRYHDEQISHSVLAHFMNLGQATGTGSYALGESFMDFFVASLQTTAQEIADVATQHIVEDLVDINFGEDEPAPRVTFQEIGSRGQVTAQAIKMLVESGVLLREPALERFMREKYGIPDKEPLPPRPAPSTDGDN